MSIRLHCLPAFPKPSDDDFFNPVLDMDRQRFAAHRVGAPPQSKGRWHGRASSQWKFHVQQRKYCGSHTEQIHLDLLSYFYEFGGDLERGLVELILA